MKQFDPRFVPAFSPREMLRHGVFGGAYFNARQRREFPAAWFMGVELHKHPRAEANAFGVLSGLPRDLWAQAHWIADQDPLGWFQWYCRYYCGRRSSDDSRQIARHRAFARHAAQIRKNCTHPFERPVQRQALLQWCHDPFPDLPQTI